MEIEIISKTACFKVLNKHPNTHILSCNVLSASLAIASLSAPIKETEKKCVTRINGAIFSLTSLTKTEVYLIEWGI